MSGFPSDLTAMGEEWDRWRTHEGAEEWKRIQAAFSFKPLDFGDRVIKAARLYDVGTFPTGGVTDVTDTEGAGS